MQRVCVHQARDAVTQHLAGNGATVKVSVAGSLLPAVVDDLAGVGDHARDADAAVLIDVHDATVRPLDHHLGQLGLLDRHHNPILAPDADSGAAALDGLGGVFDLEDAPIGREGGRRLVVASAD